MTTRWHVAVTVCDQMTQKFYIGELYFHESEPKHAERKALRVAQQWALDNLGNWHIRDDADRIPYVAVYGTTREAPLMNAIVDPPQGWTPGG